MNNKAIPPNKLLDLVRENFDKVNLKVNLLLECSIKDFVILNDAFQNQFTTLESYSNSTNKYTDLLSESFDYEQISKMFQESLNSVKQSKVLLNKEAQSIKNLVEEHQFAGFSITNLKQDLGTLGLLFTNLKFEPELKFDYQSIKTCYKNIEICLNKHATTFKESINTMSGLYEQIDENLTNLIDKNTVDLESSFALITSLIAVKAGSEQQKEIIKEITEEKKSCTSEIITKLQFQDILRQKIEHIQSAHELITQKLFEEHKPENTLTSKQLSQIRDISSLQSAQLIHANTEYQTAVETILKRFSSLTKIASKFHSIWNHYCNTELNKLSDITTDLTANENILTKNSDDLINLNSQFLKLEKKIALSFNELSNKSSNNICDCTELNELENYFKSVTSISDNNKSFSPAEQFLLELNKFKNGYNKLIKHIEKLDRNRNNIHTSLAEKTVEIANINKKLHIELLSLINKLERFKEIKNPDFDKLNNNFGIDNVSYYKTFEKEVKEIIELHDSIISKIEVDKINPNEDNLSELRELYTMQSERNVHDNITHHNEETEDDENDVEFF